MIEPLVVLDDLYDLEYTTDDESDGERPVSEAAWHLFAVDEGRE